MPKDVNRVQYLRRSKSAPPQCSSCFKEPRPSLLHQVRDSAMTFFGLNIDKSQEDWNSRRLRYLLKKYGSIKPAKLVSPFGPEPVNNYLEGVPNRRNTLGRQLSLMTQLGTPAPLSPCVVTRRNSAFKALSAVVRQSVTRRKQRIYVSPFQNGALHLPAGSLYSPAPNQNPFAEENWIGLIETPDPSVSQVAVIPSQKFTAPDIEDGKSEGPSYLTTACIPLLQRRRGRTQSPLYEAAEGPSAHVQQRDLRESSNVNAFPSQHISYVSEENVISETRTTSLIRHPRYFFPSSATTSMSSGQSRCIPGPRFTDMLADFNMESQPSPVDRASLLVAMESTSDTAIPLLPVAMSAHEASDPPPLSRLASLRPPPLILPSQPAPFDPGIPQARAHLRLTAVPSPASLSIRAFSSCRFNRQGVWAFEHEHFSPTLQALNIEAYSPGLAAFRQQCRDKARGVGITGDVNLSTEKQGQNSSNEEHPLPTAGPVSVSDTPFYYRRWKHLKDSSSSVTISPQATPFLPPHPFSAQGPSPHPWGLNNNLVGKGTSNSASKQKSNGITSGRALQRKSLLGKITSFPTRNQASQRIYQRVDQSLVDYRPYFTYFVSFVQVVVLIVACAGYGFAPVGLDSEHQVTGEILLPSLVVERVCRIEDENLWIGPRQADLIRIGARYSPCMRTDATMFRLVTDAQKKWDRRSGCCVRNDGEGCHQTSRLSCPRTTSTWLRNQPLDLIADGLRTDHSTSRLFIRQEGISSYKLTSKIGPVCGLDPAFCEEPRSTGPFAWSQTDVTEWPICRRSANVSLIRGYSEHMRCEVIARPCCVGVKGECVITTVAHCTYLRGQYHADAALCSQVNCLEEMCGMMPFLLKDQPDQLYRIYLSLFLHAGIIHLALSLIIQLLLMRNLEKLLGWLRVALIYILSGCFSSLASGIMLPYHVNTGPTGAHFALFGVVFVDYLQTHEIFTYPWTAILQQSLPIFGVLFVGFLPWLDNYAHVSGFISGVLLSYVFVPYLGFGCVKLPPEILAASRYMTRKKKKKGKKQKVENNNQRKGNESEEGKKRGRGKKRQKVLSVSGTFGDDDQSERTAAQLEALLCRMKNRRLKVVVCCALLWTALFITLLVVFLKCPLTSCAWCKYLNCLPFTNTMCDKLEVDVHNPTRCIHPHA